VASDFLDIANEALLAATVLQYRMMIADNARDLALASMLYACPLLGEQRRCSGKCRHFRF
jgi:predicted PP-loop superfamily ATPase